MWLLDGGSDKCRKCNINYGSVLKCDLLKNIFGRSDCSASKKVMAKKAGGVVGGLIFGKFAAFGWMG